MTSTTSAARTATLEDDQYNERRHRTIIFSSSWVPQGGMRDLAHLIQVDCQFGSRPKPFQNTNLQFDAGLFKPTWLTLRTHTGENNCGEMCELLSPRRHAISVMMERTRRECAHMISVKSTPLVMVEVVEPGENAKAAAQRER